MPASAVISLTSGARSAVSCCTTRPTRTRERVHLPHRRSPSGRCEAGAPGRHRAGATRSPAASGRRGHEGRSAGRPRPLYRRFCNMQQSGSTGSGDAFAAGDGVVDERPIERRARIGILARTGPLQGLHVRRGGAQSGALRPAQTGLAAPDCKPMKNRQIRSPSTARLPIPVQVVATRARNAPVAHRAHIVPPVLHRCKNTPLWTGTRQRETVVWSPFYVTVSKPMRHELEAKRWVPRVICGERPHPQSQLVGCTRRYWAR